MLFLDNTKLFDNVLSLFCQNGASSVFSSSVSVYKWFFGEVIDHIDKVPCCFIADADSFGCTVDRAKFIDFFEQGYPVTPQKLVVRFLKPDGGFKPDLFFFAFHFL